MDDPIVLCKDLTFVGASGDTLTLDWLGFDTINKQAALVLEAKTFETGTARCVLETSTDGADPTSLGQTDLTAKGRVVTEISSGVLQLVRLTITANAAITRGVFSAYLLPKRS
jgi:hypothetical protein